MVKDKVSKSKQQKDYNYLIDIIRENEAKLDRIMSGYDVMIQQGIKTKAEIEDLEYLEKTKADQTQVKEL